MTRIGIVFGTETKPTRDIMMWLMKLAQTRPDLDLRLFHASLATTAENIAAFVATGLDGIVICDTYREILFRFFEICPNHPPLVACLYTLPVESEMEAGSPCGAVVLDNVGIGRQAADFLRNFVLENFAFLGSNVRRECISAAQRCEAFQNRLRDLNGENMTFSRMMMGTAMPNRDYWDPVEDELAQWVSALPRPCGVFVNGDREAFKLTTVCSRLGISVPGELEILSINNSHGFCEQSNPTLTSIEPDYRLFAEEVIKMMLALIDDPALPRERTYVTTGKCRLVERGSTSANRIRGVIATRAREFIRKHASEGIVVSDVVEHLGVSRRLMEVLVREATGKSPLQLIQEARLDRCKYLLETTNLSITNVLDRSGYPLTANPGRIFRKAVGMTMTEYRRMYGRQGQK